MLFGILMIFGLFAAAEFDQQLRPVKHGGQLAAAGNYGRAAQFHWAAVME